MDISPPMRRLDFQRLSEPESESRARDFRTQLSCRRSVRHFSDAPVSVAAIEDCIAAAASGPSGANKQPWTFVLVTQSDVKRAIRVAAEEEEQAFYGGRAGARWLHDLQPFGTDAEKPFLEDAPALIVVFAQPAGTEKEERHYYVNESVGIAVGLLLAGLHLSGFATLTHTPAPMGFLREILGRPSNERPFLLIPVGLPAEDCEVPDIERKNLSDVLVRV